MNRPEAIQNQDRVHGRYHSIIVTSILPCCKIEHRKVISFYPNEVSINYLVVSVYEKSAK